MVVHERFKTIMEMTLTYLVNTPLINISVRCTLTYKGDISWDFLLNME